MSLSGGIINDIGRGKKMGRVSGKVRETPAEHYDRRGVLGELKEEPVEFALEEELREQILHGRRKRHLQNISIKLDPAQIQALRKIATTKSIPYQTLIRQWLAEGIRKEFRLTAK
jgi:predicted DNA binding CopG/RHH family protein